MSVSAAVGITRESRNFPLPGNIRPWNAGGVVTGDGSGGVMEVHVDFNPQSQPDFQSFVSLCSTTIRFATAAPTASIAISQLDPQWERANFNQSIVVDVLTGIDTGEVYSAQSDRVRYLGRSVKGTTARMTLTTSNVNTMVMIVQLSGLMSDQPFVPAEYWRV